MAYWNAVGNGLSYKSRPTSTKAAFLLRSFLFKKGFQMFWHYINSAESTIVFSDFWTSTLPWFNLANTLGSPEGGAWYNLSNLCGISKKTQYRPFFVSCTRPRENHHTPRAKNNKKNLREKMKASRELFMSYKFWKSAMAPRWRHLVVYNSAFWPRAVINCTFLLNILKLWTLEK
jgi:hypothetical protein